MGTARKEGIKAVNGRLDGIDSRLDRIEHLLLAGQKRMIEGLEERLKKREDALAISYTIGQRPKISGSPGLFRPCTRSPPLLQLGPAGCL